MDILVFAAIAFFIFIKLKAQLGKIDENEKNQLHDKANQKRKILENLQNQILTGQNKLKVVKEIKKEVDETLVQHLDTESKNHFSHIIKACNISAEFFLDGSKSAFEMIIKAFSKGDLETLKFLLADNIYAGFEAAVNKRKELGQTLVSNLIAIQGAEVTRASMVKKDAMIAVKFTSQQINYVTDKDDTIIEGSKEEIVELEDVWTFKKDVTANTPNWLIISTNS